MSRRALVDTGAIVALLDRKDAFHPWARAAFDSFNGPLLTCEAVLSEACFLLARARASPAVVLELLETGAVDLGFSLRPERKRVDALLRKYASVPMSLADACLVRMAELSPTSSLITLDRDFTIYRHSGRKALRVVAPFMG